MLEDHKAKETDETLIGSIYDEEAIVFSDKSISYLNFGDFTIIGKKGVDISEISSISGEAEVLFAPSTKFVVTEVVEFKIFSTTKLNITLKEL